MRGKGSGYTLAAYLAAAAQAIIIGLSFLFVKTALAEAGAMDVLSHRITIGFFGALVFAAFMRTKLRYTRRDVLRLLPAATMFPVLIYLFQTLSLRTLPSGEAGIIQASMPIFVILFATFMLGERATRLQVAFVCLSVFGVVFMLVMKGVSLNAFDILGTFFMFLSVLFSAINANYIRRLTADYHWFKITLFSLGVGAVVYTVLVLGGHLVGGTAGQYFQPFAKPGYLVSVLYLGIGSACGASILCNFALSRLESSRMTVFNNLSTVVTVAAGALFLGEHIYWYHIVGAIVIVGGIYGTNYFRAKAGPAKLPLSPKG